MYLELPDPPYQVLQVAVKFLKEYLEKLPYGWAPEPLVLGARGRESVKEYEGATEGEGYLPNEGGSTYLDFLTLERLEELDNFDCGRLGNPDNWTEEDEYSLKKWGVKDGEQRVGYFGTPIPEDEQAPPPNARALSQFNGNIPRLLPGRFKK